MVNRSTLGSKDGTGIMQYWGAQKGKKTLVAWVSTEIPTLQHQSVVLMKVKGKRKSIYLLE